MGRRACIKSPRCRWISGCRTVAEKNKGDYPKQTSHWFTRRGAFCFYLFSPEMASSLIVCSSDFTDGIGDKRSSAVSKCGEVAQASTLKNKSPQRVGTHGDGGQPTCRVPSPAYKSRHSNDDTLPALAALAPQSLAISYLWGLHRIAAIHGPQHLTGAQPYSSSHSHSYN